MSLPISRNSNNSDVYQRHDESTDVKKKEDSQVDGTDKDRNINENSNDTSADAMQQMMQQYAQNFAFQQMQKNIAKQKEMSEKLKAKDEDDDG